MRKTHSLVQVAVALMEHPAARHWGYDLSRQSGVRSPTVYRILSGMLTTGWLTDGWEDLTETQGKRPARRYYKVTSQGRRELNRIIQAAADLASAREALRRT